MTKLTGEFLNLEKIEKEDGNSELSFFWGGRIGDENSKRGEIFLYFNNSMNRFEDLYGNFKNLFKDELEIFGIKFIDDIHAAIISVNAEDNFLDYGIEDFVAEYIDELDGESALYLNGSFLYFMLINCLDFFRMFRDRGILTI